MRNGQSDRGARVLALVSDAHGGFGGISQYNRDALEAMATYDTIEAVHVLPRLAPAPLGAVPDKLKYDLSSLGGHARYSAAVAGACTKLRPIDMVYCAHINLIPLAVMAGQLLRAPVVLAIYGIDVWQPPSFLTRKLIEKSVARVISISQVTLDRFNAWAGYERGREVVVPNAVDLAQYGAGPKNPDLMTRYGLHDRTVIMTFGRMVGKDRAKGFDEVLELLPELAKSIQNLTYMAVGDGPDRKRLEDRASELGVRERVVFTGRIDDSIKADVFRLADLYVMPSRGEGFGFVVLEAMACGVPVVASTQDGTREAVLDGKLGLLVDPDDPVSIREGILKGLHQPRGVPPGLEHFSRENFSRRLRSSLTTVCKI